MPDITTSVAVDRVRATLGDDHDAVSGAVPPDVVLSFLQTEYDAVWARMARGGCVPPDIVHVVPLEDESEVTSYYSYEFDRVPLAIIDVCELVDSTEFRPLLPAQPGDGPLPFLSYATADRATHYAIVGQGDTTSVQLFPRPTSGTYVVRFIPSAKILILSGSPDDDESLSIEGLPAPGLDRVILGAARRCLLRTNNRSPGLEALIREADEDLQFHVAGRLRHNPPRIRNTDHLFRGWARRGQDRRAGYTDPGQWVWLA